MENQDEFSIVKKMILKKGKRNIDEIGKMLLKCPSTNDSAMYQLYPILLRKDSDECKEMAREICIKLSEKGYVPAQYDLALHYLYGDLFEKDIYKAIFWMEKSAASGYLEAAESLISIFSAGNLVKYNPGRADYWRKISEGYRKETLGEILTLTPEILTLPDNPVLEQSKNEISSDEQEAITAAQDFKKNCDFSLVNQDYVIKADAKFSFVVNAGPGTGKTYALIQRINHLVSNCNVDPQEIMLLSFTKAVVAEVKERLKVCSHTDAGDSSLRNVDVRTFHSSAYYYLKMANDELEDEDWKKIDLNLNRISYEDCMIKGAELFEKHPEIVEGWEYFIVDEIQDINNAKARYVIALLSACLKYEVPFMLLGDSCQAIYDYVNKKSEYGEFYNHNTAGVIITSQQFYEQVQKKCIGKCEFVSFGINHRQDSELNGQTEKIRQAIIERSMSNFKTEYHLFKQMKEIIDVNEVREFIDVHSENRICFLERRNIEAKFLSAQLIEKGIDHKCVLASGASLLPKWISDIFGGYMDDVVTRERLKEACKASGYPDDIWEILWTKINESSYKAKEIIPFSEVRRIFRKYGNQNWIENEEKHNVFVSNIHRAKGLEYDYVLLCNSFKCGNDEEEWRVFYVAVTRPKIDVLFINSTSFFGLKDKGGRHYRKEKLAGNRFRHKYVEIIDNGSFSDVDYANFLLPDMKEAQTIIRSISEHEQIMLKLDPENRRYDIVARGTVIGRMSNTFYYGVNSINRGDYPSQFDGIYIDGVFSYVGSDDEYIPCIEEYDVRYTKNRVWSYLKFSGFAHAVYEE